MASVTTARARSAKTWLTTILFYAFIALIVLVSVLPLIWILKMSMITNEELFASPPTIWPQHLTGASWHQIFNDPIFLGAIRNSAFISALTTVFCLIFGAMTAYAISRLRFRFKGSVLTLILALSFFPGVAIIGPLFKQFSELHIINTYWAAIIADTVFSLPLTVWLLVAFFKELPEDLEDAAKVDGATTIQALYKVVIPLAAPGVATTAILTFIYAWNEFLFANTFLLTQNTQTLTVVIPNFATIHTIDYGAQAAATVVATVPLVILVLIFQRRIVSGLTAGAVKG
jgi:trehalose/maltose transport system permease protein